MSIVVIYDSKTGNTEKMAKAIAEGAESVKGVGIELHKIGTRFPMRVLDEADAIVLGSPTEYSNLTPKMRTFIESIFELKAEKKLMLKSKIGGAFGSYGWDGGWIIDKLGEKMKTLGIKLVQPIVSLVDIGINENSLKKCYELGKTIAEKLVKV